ncbi:hypothetical protein C4577_05740 [Candidatus Parcubacteria bacterium]|nr:MAG: hypothetical protein C4577_05740 [Candidatus Parcubacteria bacterium]
MKKQPIRRQIFAEESVEAKSTSISEGLKDVGKSTWDGIWKELLTGSANELPKQLGGLKGELEEGREAVLSQRKIMQKEETKISAEHAEYVRTITSTESIAEKRTEMTMTSQVEQIILELKKLTQTSKEMQMMFKNVSNNEPPTKIGKYHLNFYEWTLNIVRDARIRMEEGKNWLSMFASRKKQKQYWNMFKNHGTTFGMSHERNVATQGG